MDIYSFRIYKTFLCDFSWERCARNCESLIVLRIFGGVLRAAALIEKHRSVVATKEKNGVSTS